MGVHEADPQTLLQPYDHIRVGNRRTDGGRDKSHWTSQGLAKPDWRILGFHR